MTNHTPGPWKRYHNVSHEPSVMPENTSNNGSFTICQLFGPDAVANQNLIAAAPELLAALEAVFDTAHVDVDDLGATLHALSEIRAQARAAIAKAKGE